jgi:hypothetical protein
MRLFANANRRLNRSKLETTTLNGFGGGWNAVDDDISMTPRYLVAAKNVHRTPSGAQQVRFGNAWFADVVNSVSGDIVDQMYFNGRIVAVTADGEVATVTNSGAVSAIWNASIAALLPGAPGGWVGGTTSVDFVPFKDTLIVHNGIDKPTTIDSSFDTTYLQDLATGSNVNVPIGRYGCTVSDYHVVAGLPSAPTTIYISSKGTAGVFPGDPAPNDSISIDVGAYAPEGGASIRGVAGFRSTLIVFFRSQSLLIQLGVYDSSGAHTPVFNDTLPAFGILGHRCRATVDNDLIFADAKGINSAKRNLFSGLIDSDSLSELVAPAYQGIVGALTDEQMLTSCFMVHSALGHRQFLFTNSDQTVVRSAHDKLRYKAWSEYNGWDWTSGCTSFLGRVFFSRGTRIYQLGNDAFAEQYYADRIGDRDGVWANGTSYAVDDLIRDTATEESYTCRVSHTSPAGGTFEADRTANPTYWERYDGEPITFEVELPWIIGTDPIKVKQLRFVSMQTKGTASFLLEAYADNLSVAGLSMQFIGNDAAGYGEDDGPFGGGRRSGDPRLWRYPMRFKMIKFRITGSTRAPLQLIGMSFLFARGSYRRG